MSVYVDEDRVYDGLKGDKKEILGNLNSRINKGGEPPTATMEAEKRIRREIANSNERRRMQSINNGFQSLRSLLPHHEGEKLSKAAILQQTAEYIYSLEQEKTRLLSQNCQLKRLVNQHEGGELPPKKRKTEIILPVSTENIDEGLGSMSPEPVNIISVSVTESPIELRRQLDRERSLRRVLEEQVRQFESQIFQQQQQHTQIFKVEDTDDIGLQLVTAESLPPVGHTQTIVCSPQHSPSPSPSPEPEQQQSQQQHQQQRLPSVLEAAIKAEPKVEVEHLPSSTTNPNVQLQHDDSTTTTTATSVVIATIPQSQPTTTTTKASTNRIYVSNTSRQNLETIVEAIRHLEGDHMFGDEPQTLQDVPLALTTTRSTTTTTTTVSEQKSQTQLQQQKHNNNIIKAEMNAYLDFRTTTTMQQHHQHHQQSRPGVIVVKQAS